MITDYIYGCWWTDVLTVHSLISRPIYPRWPRVALTVLLQFTIHKASIFNVNGGNVVRSWQSIRPPGCLTSLTDEFNGYSRTDDSLLWIAKHYITGNTLLCWNKGSFWQVWHHLLLRYINHSHALMRVCELLTMQVSYSQYIEHEAAIKRKVCMLAIWGDCYQELKSHCNFATVLGFVSH